MRRAAIVIVTYRRQALLAELLDSVLALTTAPWRVVVVDNEASPETERIVAGFERRANAFWGATADDPDVAGGHHARALRAHGDQHRGLGRLLRGRAPRL